MAAGRARLGHVAGTDSVEPADRCLAIAHELATDRGV